MRCLVDGWVGWFCIRHLPVYEGRGYERTML